jgi:hypothetical protein
MQLAASATLKVHDTPNACIRGTQRHRTQPVVTALSAASIVLQCAYVRYKHLAFTSLALVARGLHLTVSAYLP